MFMDVSLDNCWQLGLFLSFCSGKNIPNVLINSFQTIADLAFCRLPGLRRLTKFRVCEYIGPMGTGNQRSSLFISQTISFKCPDLCSSLRVGHKWKFWEVPVHAEELIVCCWFVCIPSVTTKETTTECGYLLDIFHNCLFLRVWLPYVDIEHVLPCYSAVFWSQTESNTK